MSGDVWFVVHRDTFGTHWQEVASEEAGDRKIEHYQSIPRQVASFRINEMFLDPPVGVLKPRGGRRG